MSLPGQRSTFVTVLAWIFIVLGGFVTLISVLQNIMVWFIFPIGEMRAAQAQAKGHSEMPWFAAWMFDHFQFFFLFFLAFSVAMLSAAIGLLMRKNWARILFVGFMGLGIVWNIGGLIAMSFFMFSFGQMMPVNQPGADQFSVMFKIMFVFNAIIALGIAWLFGWIIKRLTSEGIRGEFAAAPESTA